MRNISRTQIYEMPVPIPPLAEQKRIVAKIDQLIDICNQLEAQLNQSQINSEKLMNASVVQLLGL